MAAGGYYNHYDDPDEFWDEEPLVPPSKVTTDPAPAGFGQCLPALTLRVENHQERFQDVSTSAAGAGTEDSRFESPSKSVLIDVEVGADGLPTAIDLKRGWKNALLPSQYGQSIMDAYRYGLYELTMRYVEARVRPKSPILRLRHVAPLLLRTRTYDEFRDIYSDLFSQKNYWMHGPGVTEYGEPTLTVIATRSKLVSVEMNSGWAEETDATYIAQDILDCCNRIRSDQPAPVRDVYLERESDEEIRALVARHRQQLLWNEV